MLRIKGTPLIQIHAPYIYIKLDFTPSLSGGRVNWTKISARKNPKFKKFKIQIVLQCYE